MILSVSRRTDVPAFYSEWFMNRIRAGYLLTRNPFNPSQIRRAELSPALVDCVVFWTKDPSPMLPMLDELDALGYRYYFQFTLTPYGRQLEQRLRPKEEIIQTFTALGTRLGRERVFWRYDPIIVNDTLSADYHTKSFASLCQRLCGYTNSVTVSFVDLYRKLKTPLIREVAAEEIAGISAAFADIARRHGLPIRACCEKTDLTPYGIRPASCVDRETVEALCGYSVAAKQDKNQRPGCGCLASVDAGVYNTCKNGCVYCYANYSETSVAANFARHDPMGEFLIKDRL
ncbi:MAG: DUF1848 domain-containing protein [Oscillospiraceae bacterium]|nr:DUF1848 domain-containing protein [Oscillospiraceae bacterium]